MALQPRKNLCSQGHRCDPNNTLCRVNGQSLKCGHARLGRLPPHPLEAIKLTPTQLAILQKVLKDPAALAALVAKLQVPVQDIVA